MGLKGSRLTERCLNEDEIKQIVAQQMELDPAGRVGQSTLKKQIAMRTGIHLKR
jgi:hypothetical protein